MFQVLWHVLRMEAQAAECPARKIRHAQFSSCNIWHLTVLWPSHSFLTGRESNI